MILSHHYLLLVRFVGNKYIPSDIDPEVLLAEFNRLDNKGGGTVFFGEFITYIMKYLRIDHLPQS